MKGTLPFLGIMLVAVSGMTMSCDSDDTSTDPPAHSQFIAQDADFASFTTWQQTTAPLIGPDPAGLLAGGAHEGNDSTITRYIHINNAAATPGTDGNFPAGTILVKELKMADGTVPMITAMAKRGGEFNGSHRGWEWFMLEPGTGRIMARGDTLMGGICNGCHSAAASRDYVFTK